MLKFIGLTCWLIILTNLVNEGLVEGRTSMRAVNKSIIKTIKAENDEIIDCYDMHRQPSLNHPLLCNHTIQMRPSSYPKGMKRDNFGTLQLTQTWHKFGSCPEGTVPIRRIGKYYSSALFRKHHYPDLPPYVTQLTSQSSNTADKYEVHEYAVIVANGNFLGAQAKINLWKPFTETNELSISQVWVVASEHKNINTIEVGWLVSQALYGDDQTRFFVYWTTDGYMRSGCYNLHCHGFVHTSSNISLGCSFSEMSTFNGSQKDATFSVHKDQESGHWWVHLQGIPVGYYPSSLFTKLSKQATSVAWGGEITNRKNEGRHTSTQMGSGHFPSEGGLKRSSYFNLVQVVDENNIIKDPKNVRKRVTKPNCYDLEIDNDHYDTNGYGFYYGCPGNNNKYR